MALSRQEWLDITRHLQEQIRQADPEVFELLAEHVERRDEPERYLVAYIETLMKVMSERSGGSHGRVLNELNNWIRTENGGPLRGIRLVLPESDRQLYQRDYVDLAVEVTVSATSPDDPVPGNYSSRAADPGGAVMRSRPASAPPSIHEPPFARGRARTQNELLTHMTAAGRRPTLRRLQAC